MVKRLERIRTSQELFKPARIWLPPILLFAMAPQTVIPCLLIIKCQNCRESRQTIAIVEEGLAASNLLSTVYLMEGILARNIFQMIIVSLLDLLETLYTYLTYLSFEEEAQFGAVYIATASLLLWKSLFSLFMCYRLSLDFGWFYYKQFGPKKELAKAYVIRKTLISVFKARVIRFIVLFVPRLLLSGKIGLFIGTSLLNLANFWVFFSGPNAEVLVVRVLNVLTNALLLGLSSFSLANGISVLATADTRELRAIALYLVADTSVVVFLVGLAMVLLLMDLQNYGKGLKEANISGAGATARRSLE
jgi:hypothetical protein